MGNPQESREVWMDVLIFVVRFAAAFAFAMIVWSVWWATFD
jgi:hypothetical protein